MDDPAMAQSDLNDSGNLVQTMIAALTQGPAPHEAQAPTGVQAQVPDAEEAQAPTGVQAQVPDAEEAQAPTGVQAQVPDAEEAQVPDAEKAQAPPGGQAAGGRRRPPLVVPVFLTAPRSSGAAAAAGAEDDPPPTYEQCAGGRHLLPAFAIVLQGPKQSVNGQAAGRAGGVPRMGCIRVLRPQQLTSAARRPPAPQPVLLKRKGRAAPVAHKPAPAPPARDLEGQRQAKGREWPQRLTVLLAGLITLAVGYLDGWSAFALSYFKALPRSANGTYRGNASLVGSVVLSDLMVGPTPLQGVVDPPAAWMSSLVALGGLLGALPAGAMAESVGRKAAVVILTMPTIAAWALTLISSDALFGMYFSRLMVGFTMGVSSIVVPMYTEEIAEVRVRGSLGVWPWTLLHLGLALSLAVGAAVPFPHTTLLPCFVPLAMLVLFPGVPESPVFLVHKGLLDEARLTVRFLRGRWADVEQQLAAVKERLHPQRLPAAPAAAGGVVRRVMCACAHWLTLSRHRGTRITLLLMLYRQLSGVHAIAYFTMDMFSAAESGISGQLCAVMIGVVQIASTVLSSLAVDTVGRRPLLFFSAVGMSVSHMGLAYYFKFLVDGQDASGVWWLPVLMISSFVVMYSLGFGPLPWVVMAELIPPQDRKWATALAGAVNWGGMYLILQAFSIFTGVAGYQFAFLFFSVTCFMASVFVSLCVPETMGKTLEEIQDALQGAIKN